MILGTLDDATGDARLSPRVRQGLSFLRTTDLAALAEGRHEIDGDRLFALVQDYTTRPLADCRWEAHRKYTDIQCIVGGTERIGHVEIGGLHEVEAYDDGRDVAFFESPAALPSGELPHVTLHARMFAVFTPRDVHAPGAAEGQPAAVRKIVIKVAAG